jgi:AP-3 complex subunit mu
LIVEDVAIVIPLPKLTTRTTSGFTVNMGHVMYDEAGKVARWTLGKMDATKRATLSCSFTMEVVLDNDVDDTNNDVPADQSTPTTDAASSTPNVSIFWKVPLASVSGVSVSGLSVMRENYRPYKGVRNITKSGIFQVRV